MNIQLLGLVIVLAPLLSSITVGLFRNTLGRVLSHSITIAGISVSFLISVYVAFAICTGSEPVLNANIYTWASGGVFFPYDFHLGFLFDPLSVVMLVIVNFISLLVHIYSIGYMADDDGYARFFSYISLFTFMMLMLVSANNFLQLFFGWEGVGLVSYLLIGFWYNKESAIAASLKAFVVNRIGDFGFILGIGLLLAYVGSLDYATVFKAASNLATYNIELFANHPWNLLTLACILLYIGAMGKSAQIPLHIWLPESMEGPTPISALIHAATMVTAGVFMIARMSPLMELSTTTLTVIVVIGGTGALFTGILALVMNDIKRVIAYSTLSQLGYMMVAMGVSAYSAGIFHLLTHACFKALLFLGAGSVIIGMHHEQDMRKMGGLRRKMPITYATFIIGSVALCALPPFSGFYSKDTIIEAAKLSHIPGAGYAYVCVLIGAMVTAIYSFRAIIMTFHGKPRMQAAHFNKVHESSKVVWIPLVILAVPSIILGLILYRPILYGTPSFFGSSLFVLPEHNVLTELGKEISSRTALTAVFYAGYSPTFWLTITGILIAWVCYREGSSLPRLLALKFAWIYKLLINKYGFDAFNEHVSIPLTKYIGRVFYNFIDKSLIDNLIVNGSGRTVRWIAQKGRAIQSGYLYHYVLVMVMALFIFLYWLTR